MGLAPPSLVTSVRMPVPPHRLSSRDASFLYMERPHALLHIGCVAVVDGPLSVDALVDRIHARIGHLRRYAQRAVRAPLGVVHPSWEEDPSFDPRQHVQRWALPSPGGEEELLDAVRALLGQPLSRSRPLWEMHLIEGLDEGRTALFQKVHHCMVDGVAGAQVLEVLLDPTPEGESGETHRAESCRAGSPAGGRWGRVLAEAFRAGSRGAGSTLGLLTRPAAARRAVSRMRDAAYSALRLAAGDVPRLPWNQRIGSRRALAFTRLPMEAVRGIRAARGGTVNDVVLCVLAGALHRYLESHGIATRRMELAAVVPVSLRSPEQLRDFGNRISAMLVPLAVDLRDEVARLQATRAITGRLKAGSAWVGIDALLDLLERVPAPLLALGERQVGLGGVANLIATNVPGPRETRWLCGSRVEALHPIVPIFDGLGLGIAVFSYDGWLHVGLNADADLIPDLDKLRQAVEDAFQALRADA